LFIVVGVASIASAHYMIRSSVNYDFLACVIFYGRAMTSEVEEARHE
jgi:hypothetical protein